MANQNGKVASAIHCQAQVSFSTKQAKENTRDKCDRKAYEKKNASGGHHYDYSRKKLNFCVVKGEDGKPTIRPLRELTAQHLMQRYVGRLAELDFKAYREDAKVHANSYIDWVFSGDHDRMCEMAYGGQKVDFTLKHDNGHVRVMPEIEAWAMDVYQFACAKFGEENVFGFEVHLDETTPHAHLNAIPVAKRKMRGRSSFLYAHKDDGTKTITSAEYRNLNSSERKNYIKTDKQERNDKECVSYSGLMGETKEARRLYLRNFHTEFYEKVGVKYGLERGDYAEDLTDKQRANRRHKSATELEEEHLIEEDREEKVAELKALDDAISKMQSEKERLDKVTGIGAKVQRLFGFGDSVENEQRVQDAEQRADTAETQASDAISQMNIAIHEREEAEESARKAKAEAERMAKKAKEKELAAKQAKEKYDVTAEAIRKEVVADMRKGYASEREGKVPADEFNTPYKLGQYAARLRTENDSVRAENKSLLSARDENETLRSQVSQMQTKVDDYDRMSEAKTRAENDASRYRSLSDANRQRADRAEGELRYILSFPEIKTFLDQIKKNLATFKTLLMQWINDGRKAIREFASPKNTLSDFSRDQQQRIFKGILAQTHIDGLDATKDGDRHAATEHLMKDIDWSGTTDFRMDIARKRAFQFSDALRNMLDLIVNIVKAFTQCSDGRTSITTSLGSNTAADTLSNWRGNSITARR